jgi:DNA polymerase III subunit delta'
LSRAGFLAMSFAQFSEYAPAVQLLQRSVEGKRLGHAYLFVGPRLEKLEAVARTLAKTLNCETRGKLSGRPDSCDHCANCRKIDEDLHPDVTWVRPESKLRVIRVDQMRELIRTVNLKPTQAAVKFGIIAAADRLNEQAANAFLKTLEEPPQNSLLLLLTADPAHLLETVRSRCLRLNFADEEGVGQDQAMLAWLAQFGETAVNERGSLLSRYRLLSVLLKRLAASRETIEQEMERQSPLERYEDAEPELREKWEDELKAAIEAEYRRQRAGLLSALQWWLRDVWLQTLPAEDRSLALPQLKSSTRAVAGRITSPEAMENLRAMERTQWLLQGNTQEALALEVGLLKLKL